MKKIILLILVLLSGAGIVFAMRYEPSKPENKPAENKQEAKVYKLAFAGDIMLTRNVGKQIKLNDDYRFPFFKIGEELKKYDFTVGNLENPMSDKGADQKHYVSFRADPGVVEGLKYAGFDFVALANNHIWDWGREALIQTKEILDDNSILSTGAGKNAEEANKPVIMKFGTTTVGILSYTPLFGNDVIAGTSSAGTSNFKKAKDYISQLKKEVDLVIIFAHWGDEYKTNFNPREEKVAHEWIDTGADLIVGTHPHVVQKVAEYKGKYIIYSLGNFVFDQNFSAPTMNGLLVEIELKDGKFQNLKKRNIRINEVFQPTFLD